MQRTHSWPEGHWNWPVNLTHKHGVRVGNMIYTGGQVDLDISGTVRNSGDLARQCMASMAYLQDVLRDLEADFSDLVKLIVYFTGDHHDEAELLKQIADIIGADVRPAVSMIALPELCYPGLRVEIEGIAMKGDTLLPRKALHLPNMPQLPQAFSHVVQCEDMIFTSDILAMDGQGAVHAPGDVIAQTTRMMENLATTLAAVGAVMSDVAKLNVFYLGGGTAEEWEAPARIRADCFPDPGPAPTGMPLTAFAHPDVATRIHVTAMRAQDGTELERRFAWPKGHWDWTTPLPYKHGNMCGQMIHVGGQVSLNPQAGVIDPDDMVAQTRRAMDNVARVLAEFDATLDDVVKVTTFYEGRASAEALHENLMIRSNSYRAPGPATTGVPMPALVYEGMVIEIEVIAIKP